MFSFPGHQYYTLPATHGRHLPPNPPEPDHDVSHTPPPQPSFQGAGQDLDGVSAGGHHPGISSERSRFQPRRTSTLFYQNSGAGELRDRGNSRGPRNLVVVTPPPDFPLEQGQLGNVLSMGPRHRLTQGILIPLFPSMSGQLNAIAREYNFPSIMGLCLYLHINENGIIMTPRISDDSWQYLFGHLFDARPASNGYQLPIGGCIQFDIDLNKARWFESWVSGTFRDPEPAYPPVAHSRASSVARHWREESRTTIADEQPFEERWDVSGSQTLAANSRPETLRHLPRKLSLVESHHSGPKVDTQPNTLPETNLTHALSPIPQSAAIPQTANSDLEHRVNSWRESTELFPVSMTNAYQPAVDVAIPAVVTTLDTYALDRNFHPEANLDEYHLSVTSAGPNDPMTGLPVLPPRPSSVHIGRRATGSVPLTPATATSWGPADDECRSVLSNVSQLPSPDLGERVVEDTEAPRLRALWGNSFGWRTATTWRDVYPYSDTHAKPAIEIQLKGSRGLVSLYPNLVIYPPVSPDFERPESSPQWVWGSSYSTATQFAVPVQFRSTGNLEFKYPNLSIYPAVYPFFEIYPPCTVEDISQPLSVTLRGSTGLVASYPNLVIYPAVYPHFDIYPSVIEAVRTKAQEPTSRAQMELISVQLAGPGGLHSEYPHLVIYPAAYPHFDIYPARVDIIKVKELQVTKYEQAVALVPHYPNLIIYPATYPHLDIYPPFAKALITSDREKGQRNLRRRRIEAWRARTAAQVGLAALLANNHNWEADEPLELNLGEYAWSVTSAGPSISSPVRFYRNLHRPSSVHPARQAEGSVLPTPSTATTWGPQDYDWYSDTASIERLPSPDIAQRVFDDAENPFRSHQPWRLVWPFLRVREESQANTPVLSSTALEAHYPNLIIYPAAYPHFDIYPARMKASTPGNRVTESLIEAPRYPVLDICPSVYPYFNIYPSVDLQTEVPRMPPSDAQDDLVQVRLPALYPNLSIYPASYPYNLDCIYPSMTVNDLTHISVEAPSSYPWLVVYPPVYPFVIPYPSFTIEIDRPWKPTQSLPDSSASVSVRLPAQYPTFDLYPASYLLCLESTYPTISVDVVDVCSTSVALPSLYPCIEIYPSVYPFVRPYPQAAGMSDSIHIPGSLDKVAYTRAQGLLALAEYKLVDPHPAGYPHFDLYPAVSVESQQRETVQDSAASNGATPLPRSRSTTRRERKTHIELHISVFRSLEKQLAQQSKTHIQLHDEMFLEGVVWTPSGDIMDLTALTSKGQEDAPVREQRRRPPPIPEALPVRQSHPRSGTPAKQSPDNVVSPLGQLAAHPLRVRSPGVSSQSSPAPSLTHTRSVSSRLTQAVKSTISGAQRRNSSAALGSPPADDQKERTKDQQSPTRFLSTVDRRPTVVPPFTLPHTNTTEFLTRAPVPVPPKRESLVLQRARAYEQSNGNR